MEKMLRQEPNERAEKHLITFVRCLPQIHDSVSISDSDFDSLGIYIKVSLVRDGNRERASDRERESAD